MQPIIGITMAVDDYDLIRQGVTYSFIRREYAAEIRRAGGQPIFLESHIDPETAAGLCDGIVISGGEDIDPSQYGETQFDQRVLEPVERTEWERKLIDVCDKQGKHILGICYGSQLLNVHYGGTLYQDIDSEVGSQVDHGSSSRSAFQRVSFAADFLGFSKGDSVESAHRHHQAVGTLAPGFSAIATTEDGVIEAIAGHGHYGIQWHSESDGTAPIIYNSFVQLCAGASEDSLGVLDHAPQLA